VNPIACAEAVRTAAPGLKVAMVLGDDVTGRIDEFLAKGYQMADLDTGRPLTAIRDRILSANAYTGAFPLAEALATGAHVVLAGRAADPALALAPMIHEFGWASTDWNKLASGSVAGHIIECSTQTTGGNCQVDWQNIPDMANIGYPIVEVEPDGTFVVTKHPGTGGRVHSDVVKEQLLYELGDPKNFIAPDCIADFTTIHLDDIGPDHVRVSGVHGRERPANLKLSISYANGWKAIGTLVYSWPQALEKARAADRIVRARLASLGLHFEEIYTEFLGASACHGSVAHTCPDPPEVQLRIGVRGRDRKAVDRFTRELIPLVLSGPPVATGYGEGRPPVREIVAYWPALIPREEIRQSIEVLG
jgi:Acyclic terpene utilisation family protein AtuA